ncbi:MAG: (2Fe-2S)-binding protein [Sarcina sp.]
MGLFSRNSDIICKCNKISKDDIIASIKNGAKTFEEVKAATGAGAGACKGLRCKKKINQLIEEN